MRECPLFLTPGADARKLKRDAGDLEVGAQSVLDSGNIRGVEDVSDLAADVTADMVMGRDIPVKTLLSGRVFEFADQSERAQHFEVSIVGAKADARHFLAHHAIYFIRGGMGCDGFKLFQDDFSLVGQAHVLTQ